MYSRKVTSPNHIEFSKNQTKIVRFAWSQNLTREKLVLNPAFNYSGKVSWYNSKKHSKYILVKRKEKQSWQSEILLFTMLRTLDSFLYWNSLLIRSQLWIRRLLNKHPYIQNRLLFAKGNEAMKQITYVNYTLNEFKEMSQVLAGFIFVENCKVLKIIFYLVLMVNSMSWNIGFSRNLIIKLHDKLRLFQIVLEKSSKKSLTIIESQNLPNLQNLDVDSQLSHFEWTLHNGRRKILIGHQSDTKKIFFYNYKEKNMANYLIYFLQYYVMKRPSKNLALLLMNAL